MRKFAILAALSVIGAGGCAQITQGQADVSSFIKVDAATASVLAKSDQANPVAGAARSGCYTDIGNLAVPTKGVLTAVEQAQQGQELAQGPCAPVMSGVLINILQHIPLPAP